MEEQSRMEAFLELRDIGLGHGSVVESFKHLYHQVLWSYTKYHQRAKKRRVLKSDKRVQNG